jgi:hypothetical protein
VRKKEERGRRRSQFKGMHNHTSHRIAKIQSDASHPRCFQGGCMKLLPVRTVYERVGKYDKRLDLLLP